MLSSLGLWIPTLLFDVAHLTLVVVAGPSMSVVAADRPIPRVSDVQRHHTLGIDWEGLKKTKR